MASYLKQFLVERNCDVTGEFARRFSRDYPGPQVVLATEDTVGLVCPESAALRFAGSTRDEAYVLEVRSGVGAPVVALTGKGISGLRAAAARLTCKIVNDGESLRVAEGREEADPFIKLRLFMLGNSGRRQAPMGSPFKDIDYETWPLDRIRAYPELFWQFGFNGVQAHEIRGYGVGLYHGPWSEQDLARIRRCTQTFFKAARELHLFTSLFQWGDCLFAEGATHSWNHPDEQPIIRGMMDEIVAAYGDYVDHFVIHVGDPGGCTRDGCDHYKTPQQLTAAYLAKFRSVNPKVQATLSTWANPHFWFHSPRTLDMLNYYTSSKDNVAGSKRYCDESNRSDYTPLFGVQEGVPKYGQVKSGEPVPDGARFLDDSFMPVDVGIGLNRVYNEDQADQIAASGRPLDIWGWYIGDMEMCNTYWLTMRSVDKMLGAYPDKARDQVRLQTVELTFHGWPQVINAYVGAQKLWNPRRPLDEIEREFCVAGFGPMNADAVLALYRACENGVLHPLPKPDDFGTDGYHAKLGRVIDQAGTIRFPPGWKPNFAFPVPAQSLVDRLVARARLILAVSVAAGQVGAARKSGATAEQIAVIKAKAIEAIPELPIDPLYRQDAAIINPVAKTDSYAEIIAGL